MNILDQKYINLLEAFTEKTKSQLEDNLIAVILYGSLARGEHIKKHSDINLLIVLKTVTLEELQKIALIKRNRKFHSISPLVFSEDYLTSSTDTFPIEFLDMKDCYTVLFGKDCLKGLEIGLGNLRRQCEWELKSKLIQLRQVYINSQGKKKLLEQLMLKELPSFIVVFKNVLRLKNINVLDKEEILRKIKIGLNINNDILEKLWNARLGRQRIKDIRESFREFLTTIERISDAIDKMPG